MKQQEITDFGITNLPETIENDSKSIHQVPINGRTSIPQPNSLIKNIHKPHEENPPLSSEFSTNDPSMTQSQLSKDSMASNLKEGKAPLNSNEKFFKRPFSILVESSENAIKEPTPTGAEQVSDYKGINQEYDISIMPAPTPMSSSGQGNNDHEGMMEEQVDIDLIAPEILESGDVPAEMPDKGMEQRADFFRDRAILSDIGLIKSHHNYSSEPRQNQWIKSGQNTLVPGKISTYAKVDASEKLSEQKESDEEPLDAPFLFSEKAKNLNLKHPLVEKDYDISKASVVTSFVESGRRGENFVQEETSKAGVSSSIVGQSNIDQLRVESPLSEDEIISQIRIASRSKVHLPSKTGKVKEPTSFKNYETIENLQMENLDKRSSQTRRSSNRIPVGMNDNTSFSYGHENQQDSQKRAEPRIQISIGRIEVKATASPPSKKPSRSASPLLSLDEYLRQRAGGNR